jgi:phage FluMu protein Com
MIEIRCVKCNRRLFDAEICRVEIKCPKCGFTDLVEHPKGWTIIAGTAKPVMKRGLDIAFPVE